MTLDVENVPWERRCAIYTRISDDREGDERGVARQREDCEVRAAQLGLTVVGYYEDNDRGASERTAANKIRKDYARMLADARTESFGVIMAYSNSRLTRRVREWLDLVELYEDHGVKIKTVNSGDRDLETADDKAVALTLVTWDAAEANRISERVKRTNLQKARQGLPAKQHRRPFGFEDDHITHRPAEAHAIREAVQEIISGASITSIARKWESQGIKTATGGSKWKWAPVYRVLLGWRTAGIREYPEKDPITRKMKRKPLLDENGAMVRGVWNPIISLEEREAALAKLEERSRRGQREGKWLLQGFLQCGICGRRLYGALQSGNRPSSYTCTGSGTTHLGISSERVEHYIERVLLRYLLDKAIHGVPNEQPKTAQPWPGEERLADVIEKSKELMDAHSSGLLPASLVFPQVAQLTHERDELERDRSRHRAEQLQRPQRVDSIESAVGWFTGQIERTFEERRQALRDEIDFVIIGAGGRGYSGRAFEGAKDAGIERRVSIQWKLPHHIYNGVTSEEAIQMPFDLPSSSTGETEGE